MEVALAALALIAGDLAQQPYRVGKALQAPLEGRYSARRGDYRILYRISGQVITVLDIKHRRDAYPVLTQTPRPCVARSEPW
jgi:mRNA interferase RelE/StbE